MGGLGLRDLPVRVRLGGVDDVGELDAVLDEEDRHVVADKVEVALSGVELDREAADVADRVGRAARPDARWRTARRPVSLVLAARKPAAVTLAALPYARNTPWAAAPRACTTRSGIRSWSKWVIFSRRWKSSISDGPRGPAFREWSVSGSRTPWAVVRKSPSCDVAAATGSLAGAEEDERDFLAGEGTRATLSVMRGRLADPRRVAVLPVMPDAFAAKPVFTDRLRHD